MTEENEWQGMMKYIDQKIKYYKNWREFCLGQAREHRRRLENVKKSPD